MKHARRCCITLCILVSLFLFLDIYAFLNGRVHFGSYSILPFRASPCYFMGTHFVMFPIIEANEDSHTENSFIGDKVQRSAELNSLHISHVASYAWKKDSLLMEVVLDDESTQWLLASPTTAIDSQYICQLQAIDNPSKEYISSYRPIRLKDNAFETWIRNKFEDLDEAKKKTITFVFFLMGVILGYLFPPTLYLVCWILWIKHYVEWKAEPSIYKKMMDILMLLYPLIVYILFRELC